MFNVVQNYVSLNLPGASISGYTDLGRGYNTVPFISMLGVASRIFCCNSGYLVGSEHTFVSANNSLPKTLYKTSGVTRITAKRTASFYK